AYAKKYNMVMVVPMYEKEQAGVLYNTAAVIDADGRYLGKYRKNHIPHTSGFYEKMFFKPGNLGYPTFQTKYAKVGVYICYDRHFPEGARLLGLHGAEIVFNPSATVAGLSEYLWKLEQPAHAVANGYFIAASNRGGMTERGGVLSSVSWSSGRRVRVGARVASVGDRAQRRRVDAEQAGAVVGAFVDGLRHVVGHARSAREREPRERGAGDARE